VSVPIEQSETDLECESLLALCFRETHPATLSGSKLPYSKGELKMNRRGVAAVLFLPFLVLPVVAFASGQQVTETKVDYGSVHRDIVSFEAVINNVVSSTFASTPFAVVQKPKGVYLDGYGITFAFLINIHTAVINTPFGAVQRGGLAPDLKLRRIEELKEKLIRVLQDNSEVFRQLPKEDWITIVAYVEDRNIPDEPNANKTVVLSTLKKDLDELGHRSDRLKEFRMRMKIVEY
jgi:hypothetical protein